MTDPQKLPAPVKGVLLLASGGVLLFTGYGAIVGVIFILLGLMAIKE